MTLALLINPLEIDVAEQARAAWKSGAAAWTGQIRTAIRNDGAHNLLSNSDYGLP
jgi:hypothetical protein